ncbi:MAG: hypothetical protein ACTTJ3_04515 [Treponema sp.]
MDIKVLHLKLFFLFFLIFSFTYVFGEESNSEELNSLGEHVHNEEHIEKNISTKKKDNYYFNILENGDIEFKQLISWKSLFGVLYYEVSIREKETQQVVLDGLRSEKNTVEVSLKPGFYEYRVDAYNMLSQKEVSSEWADIEVKKAYMPFIKNVSPKTVWIEDELFNLQVTGNDFASDSKIVFVSDGIIKKTIKIEPKERTNKYISFHFKKPEMFLGAPYRVKITDESGLSQVSEQFFVKYRRPVVFYTGLGYSFFSPITDKYYLSRWNAKFYPIGFVGNIGLIFSRQSFGYFGVSSRNTFRVSNLGVDDIFLKNFSFLSSINLVYEFWFIKKLSFYFSAGGGVAINNFQFVYSDAVDEGVTFVDPMYNLALGLRAKVHTFIYLDVVLKLEQLLNNQVKPVFISPEISLGFRY